MDYLPPGLKNAPVKQSRACLIANQTLLKITAAMEAGLNWLIPRRCINCMAPLSNAQVCCDDCYPKLPYQENCCSKCGQAFVGIETFCGRCIANPPPFNRCFAAFRYEPPISELIHKLKYRERPDYAAPIAKLWAAEILAEELEMPDLLIPVPLHISRLRHRGYNQAALLCRGLARELGVPYSISAVKKIRKTATQASLSLAQRQQNLRRCFQLGEQLTARHVAVIDDVYTTGSTAAEISRLLRKNGVEHIQIWTLAHTL